MIIVADPPVATPADGRRSGRAIVYVQANIHGGEVEGKESAQVLLRDLTVGGNARHLLERLIIIVVPIYNIDGNEAWGPEERNRRDQNGPERIGQRANGMGLDLNRDCMKAESPEMLGALAKIYTTWDPDMVVDLHTTNGTRHGYDLTYSPPLGPDTEAGVLAFARDSLLPQVRARLKKKYGMETFDYGNVESGERQWETFSPLSRYVTNYAGARTRIGVLSEATSYLPFRRRVEATHRFLREVLEVTFENASQVTELTRAADERVAGWGVNPEAAPPRGVRFELQSRGIEEVILEEGKKKSGAPVAADLKIVSLPVLDRFVATQTARAPRAYLIPPAYPEVAALLERHGVIVEETLSSFRGEVELFQMENVKSAREPFEGHRLTTLEGHFKKETREVPAGTYLVRLSQPLGVLIFQLLEPESSDGVVAWGWVSRSLRVGSTYPILKSYRELPVARRRIPGLGGGR